jgi:hypothetical protein
MWKHEIRVDVSADSTFVKEVLQDEAFAVRDIRVVRRWQLSRRLGFEPSYFDAQMRDKVCLAIFADSPWMFSFTLVVSEKTDD